MNGGERNQIDDAAFAQPFHVGQHFPGEPHGRHKVASQRRFNVFPF